ncbi:MAG: hypothetical protein HUU46_03015 [Candidatus Hydrogenedentes bacterium]|nr:hypothetical protein [Candidatus Hydrogenedentota bacterium]
MKSRRFGHRRNAARTACGVMAFVLACACRAEFAIPVVDALTLEHGRSQSFKAAIPAPPEGRRILLTLFARVDFEKVAGYNNAMRIVVNGKALTGAQLVNKPARVKARSGDVYSMAAGELFSVYYSPDFTSPDTDPHYGLAADIRPCVFEFDITDLAKEGENEITFTRATGPVTNPLVIGTAQITWRDAQQAKPPRRPAPTGPLPIYEPQAEHKTGFEMIDEKPGTIVVRVGGDSFTVQSRFSVPGGGWASGVNEAFDYSRNVEQKAETIVVKETFTNKTGKPLGIIQQHTCSLGGALKRAWLSGLEQPDLAGTMTQPTNPTTYGATDSTGIGFIPLSDAFRVHATNAIENGTLALSDNFLVIAPGATHTAEWAIVPTATPDYWAFLNAVRRLIDANFTIDGGFAFLRSGPPVMQWTDQQIADFIRMKDVKYTCASNDYPRYNGHYAHGTAFQRLDHSQYIVARDQRRRVAPNSKYLVYFHCFIDVAEDAPELFPDSRLIMPDGAHATYGEPHDKIYFPTESNSFGKEIGKNVDVILDKIGADGVYWDEHEYSRYHYHYGEPWDQVSGDIDPTTHEVTRLKSSVTLLTEQWRLALAKRILARGPMIGNGPAVTRARAALKFPCFVETGSITNCTQAHLHSPIALGDHLTEYSEQDAYATMAAALDYGCVYHWYNDVTVVPTHHTLTKYMYPFTPIELHEGYVIGRERILTNRSGLFGWGDSAKHEVHIFDDTGSEVESFTAPLIERDGKTFTELRLAEGWTAAIVRR